jgi:23S rRNA (cytidine1920-2'-O)/16S rRNA (cytidine1409-2'-O)-methyltransferase
MKKKERLDSFLSTRGMADSTSAAQRLVMAGQVRVNGQVVLQPGAMVSNTAEITVESGPRFVSRGGEKLQAALGAFSIPVTGRICVDVGASTGGFTDCLLQNGAARVYAIDVGKGILDWKLRQDLRVIAMEGTNARSVAGLPESPSLVTIDVSFISLKVLLPIVRDWLDLNTTSDIIPLVKPQFEARREQAGRGKGVIRDEAVHRQVLQEILHFAHAEGFNVLGLIRSPLSGPKGNMEFLTWLQLPPQGQSSPGNVSFENLIESILPQSK